MFYAPPIDLFPLISLISLDRLDTNLAVVYCLGMVTAEHTNKGDDTMVIVNNQGACFFNGNLCRLKGYSNEDDLVEFDVMEGPRAGTVAVQPRESVRNADRALLMPVAGEDPVWAKA